MTWSAVGSTAQYWVPAVASLAGGILAGNAQKSAASDAAGAQVQAAQLGIDEQRRQFDAIQKLLEPFVTAGTGSLTKQQDLLGLNGNGPQQQAITALQASPAFTSALKLGENSILANASATGGLRGGNTQAALAQFSPALLASTINDQYAKLAGLTSLGQNSAAGVGNAGVSTGNNVTSLLQQIGASNAGSALASGRASAGQWNLLSQLAGSSAGSGLLGKLFGGGGDPTGGLGYQSGVGDVSGSPIFGWKGAGGF